MAFIEVSDFAGKWKVPQDQFTNVKVQKYIDLYMRWYMCRVLGVTLANDFINDVGGNRDPSDPDFISLSQMFYRQEDCGTIHRSIGMRNTIIGFIYFEYMKDEKIQVSISSGTTKSEQEMGQSGLVPEAQVYSRYNDSVDSAHAIQWYCEQNPSKYPDYKGQPFVYNYSL